MKSGASSGCRFVKAGSHIYNSAKFRAAARKKRSSRKQENPSAKNNAQVREGYEKLKKEVSMRLMTPKFRHSHRVNVMRKAPQPAWPSAITW